MQVDIVEERRKGKEQSHLTQREKIRRKTKRIDITESIMRVIKHKNKESQKK